MQVLNVPSYKVLNWQNNVVRSCSLLELHSCNLNPNTMSSNIYIERICHFCNSKFIARTTKTKFCSHRCSSRSWKHTARQEKLAIAKIESTITGKIRTKVNFPELVGKELLTITEASALLNITHVTLRHWIKEERIISSRIGKKHLIKRIHLDALIA